MDAIGGSMESVVNSSAQPEPEGNHLSDFPWIDFAFFFTTTTLILTLNGTVLVVLAKIGVKKLKKSVHNVQILSLSVSDIMVGVSLIPMQVSFYAGEMTHLQCAVRCGVFMVAFMASMLHVCIICIDRWWVIYFKVTQTKTQFLPRCMLLITSTWTLAFVVEFIPLVLWRDSRAHVICSIGTIFGDFFNEAFAYLAFTHTSVLVCVTIFYCFIIVFIMKRRSKINVVQNETIQISISNNTGNGSGCAVNTTESPIPFRLPNFFSNDGIPACDSTKSTPHNKKKRSVVSNTNSCRSTVVRKSDAKQRRALKTIGLIVSFHVLCVGPLIILLFAEVISDDRASLTWHHAMFCLACLSSAINPLLYAFRVPEIRKTLLCKDDVDN
ncbi:hypothetical protein FSP39_023747 [Pinctada imbricata]|uniref:G-protein coupled receptors family 1 profile domain-containing protein n=1 Tax=Pinctada imbricata TaxID=66713 RepID=A0AA88YU00_PINIB|nr:hypothetical protein FSP39_023747 [Pinctada imbricata]